MLVSLPGIIVVAFSWLVNVFVLGWNEFLKLISFSKEQLVDSKFKFAPCNSVTFSLYVKNCLILSIILAETFKIFVCFGELSDVKVEVFLSQFM